MSVPVILLWSNSLGNQEVLSLWLAPLGSPVRFLEGEEICNAVLAALQEDDASLLVIDSETEPPAFFSQLNRLAGEPRLASLPLIWTAPALSSSQRRLFAELLHGIDVIPKPCQPRQLLAAALNALRQDVLRRAVEASHAGADWQSTRRQGLLGLAADGRILYANPVAARLLRVDISRLPGLYWQSLMETPVSALAPRPLPALAAALEQHSAVEVQRCPLWQEDGRRILCHAAVAPIEAGELRMLFAFRELSPAEAAGVDPVDADAGQDLLTGLPRLLALEQSLDAMLRREEAQPALILMDIDHLRHVNETLGYELGDKLLQQAANRLRDVLEGVGPLFRIGGDRFAALMERAVDFREAGRLAQRLNAQFRHAFLLTGHEVHCGLSVGVALWPGSGDTAEALLRSAEIALGRAKSLGRNVVQFYSAQMNRHSLEQLERETALHQLLALPTLPLRLEPWTNRHGEPVAAGVLLDWEPPGGSGVLLADVAAEAGLECQLGQRLIQEVLAKGLGDAWVEGLPRLMFTLSLSCLRDPRSLTRLAGLLAPRAGQIQLNLTLTGADWAWAEPALRDLVARGVRLGLRVSGQGPALEALGRLPWHDLVLQPALVQDCLADARLQAVLSALCSFAAHLGLRVLAEGVETPAEADSVYRLGVDACGGGALVGTNNLSAIFSDLRDSFNKSKLRY